MKGKKVKKVKGTSFISLLILTAAFTFSCSLDYREALVAEELSEKTPETVLVNFKYTRVRQGEKIAFVEGERGETFSKKNETVLYKVHFIEYDKEGGILNEGRADQAVYNNKTGNAEIHGNIYVYSYKEKAEVTAADLNWTGETKILKGRADEIITLKKDDGSYIEGKGFTADFKHKSIRFFSNVKGRYVSKEK